MESAAWAAGALACRRREPLPPQVREVWGALRLPGLVAGERLAAAGRTLAGALLDGQGQELVAGLLGRLAAGGHRRGGPVRGRGGPVAASGADPAARGRGHGGGAAGADARGSSVTAAARCHGRGWAVAPPPCRRPGAGLAGPLKVLAAVAAPEETRTANAPLDTEAEMDAVLDAVAPPAGPAQVRILEVASLAAIRQALDRMPIMCCTCPRTARRRRSSWKMRTGTRSRCAPVR